MTTVALGLFAFGVSVLTLFSGFGLGTLLMPAFALFLPVHLAVASTAVVHGLNNLFKTALLGGQARWDVVVRFGLPAVVGASIGALLLATLPGRTPLLSWSWLGRTNEVTGIKLLMGLLILAFATLELFPEHRALRAPVRWLPIGGAVSGFFGGLSGHQGALRAIFLAPLDLTATQFASTQAVLGLLVDGVRLLVYGWSFALTPSPAGSDALPWHLLAVATGSAFAGTLLGKRLLPTVTIGRLHRIVGTLLVVVGIALAAGLA